MEDSIVKRREFLASASAAAAFRANIGGTPTGVNKNNAPGSSFYGISVDSPADPVSLKSSTAKMKMLVTSKAEITHHWQMA